jgi:hypothetical protein
MQRFIERLRQRRKGGFCGRQLALGREAAAHAPGCAPTFDDATDAVRLGPRWLGHGAILNKCAVLVNRGEPPGNAGLWPPVGGSERFLAKAADRFLAHDEY